MTHDSLGPVALHDTARYRLESTAVGDEFEIWVAPPIEGFAPVPDSPPEVLLVLDANLYFGTVVETTRLMHMLYGELPPFFVVGVAYPTRDPLLQGALRTRDFTPSDDSGFEAMSASMPKTPEIEAITPKMGGASAFLHFLQDEVTPFVAARYESSGTTTLFGSSLGGLFVTHVLMTDPGAFGRYIAVSPALWWNQGEILAAAAPMPVPAAYLAAGGHEESPSIPALAPFRMISNARALASRLGVTFEVLEGESHTSVVGPALTRGLRSLTRAGSGA